MFIHICFHSKNIWGMEYNDEGGAKSPSKVEILIESSVQMDKHGKKSHAPLESPSGYGLSRSLHAYLFSTPKSNWHPTSGPLDGHKEELYLLDRVGAEVEVTRPLEETPEYFFRRVFLCEGTLGLIPDCLPRGVEFSTRCEMLRWA